MGRFEQRRERNKKLIEDVNNLIFDCYQVRENDLKLEDHKEAFYGYVQGSLHLMFLSSGWCWVDLVTALNLIRNRMIDLGKSSEFEELYNEYKPEDENVTSYSYGNWDFACIFIFTSHLIIDFPEAIQAIAKDQEKEME